MEDPPKSQKKMVMKSSGKGPNFLKLVQEREMLKKNEKQQASDHDNTKKNLNDHLVPSLPKDCIVQILLRLPLDLLWRSRLVSKLWCSMINSSFVAETFFQKSETVFIFLKPSQEEKCDTFCVDEHLHKSQSISIFCSMVKHLRKFQMHYMEIKDGKSEIRELDISCFGRIIATCNGLVLLENTLKRGGLLVVNPVTRQLLNLPLGTTFPPEKESYAFAYSPSSSKYKVVHLFRDEMGFIGCEVIVLGEESWKAIDGPSYGLFSWFGNAPVSAIGALHWIPQKLGTEYLVSMKTDTEKFYKTPLPSRSGGFDGLLEMGGSLCFVNHVDDYSQIDIWVLKDLSEMNWVKQHRICLGNIKGMLPLASSRNGSILYFCKPFTIGDKDYVVFVYDVELYQMSKVRIDKQNFPSNGSCFPHINSLLSWKNHKSEGQRDI